MYSGAREGYAMWTTLPPFDPYRNVSHFRSVSSVLINGQTWVCLRFLLFSVSPCLPWIMSTQRLFLAGF